MLKVGRDENCNKRESPRPSKGNYFTQVQLSKNKKLLSIDRFPFV